MITLTEADRAAERVLADIPAKTIATTDGPVTVARPWETYLIARFGVEETERMLTTNVGATIGECNMATDRVPRQKFEGKGKCEFIDGLYEKGGMTTQQIFEAATAAFPGSDPAKMMSNVKIRPYIMMRNGKKPDWIHDARQLRSAASKGACASAIPVTETASSQAAIEKKAVKREGKFNFIKQLITAKTHTRAQLMAAVTAQFSDWTPELVNCGIFAARSQLRKAAGDDSIGWLPEPATEPAAPQNASESSAEETPHIVQHTEVSE